MLPTHTAATSWNDRTNFFGAHPSSVHLQLQGHDDSLAIILAGNTRSVPQDINLQVIEQVDAMPALNSLTDTCASLKGMHPILHNNDVFLQDIAPTCFSWESALWQVEFLHTLT